MSVALVTNECQIGAIGDEALWPALRQAAEPMIPVLARLLDDARKARVHVVHFVAVRRPDMLAANRNAPLFEASVKAKNLMLGSRSVELVPEFGPEPTDLVLRKTHGVASIRSTGLDNVLRSLGVDTVVLTGVSLNVAIPALAFESVNLGYRVVIPRDAVAGVPPEYGLAVLENSLSLVAEIVDAETLGEAWATS